MNSKKFGVYVLLSLFIISLLSMAVVSAADPNPTVKKIVDFFSNVFNGVQGVGQPLFNLMLGTTESPTVTFAKILVFLLVILIVMATLDLAAIPLFVGPSKLWLRISIGVIISLLGVRFLPEDLITQIALPSSAMAAAMVIVLPFLIYGIFVYNTIKSSTFRKSAWAVFLVILSVLWWTNWDKPWYSIYPILGAVCLALMVFDGLIITWINQGRKTRASESFNREIRRQVIARLGDLQKQYLTATTKTDRTEILAQINDLKIDLKSGRI